MKQIVAIRRKSSADIRISRGRYGATRGTMPNGGTILMEPKDARNILEALLFITEQPVPLKVLRTL